MAQLNITTSAMQTLTQSNSFEVFLFLPDPERTDDFMDSNNTNNNNFHLLYFLRQDSVCNITQNITDVVV